MDNASYDRPSAVAGTLADQLAGTASSVVFPRAHGIIVPSIRRQTAKNSRHSGYGQPAPPPPATCDRPSEKMTRPALGELPLAAPFPPSEC